eukprot:TRINITY_DN22595_c0_g1_i1.p1 TRINITY_DN22595_c0_g1~~TRINITY_DN22595_c0_g1_i1.p1  ORF type:complete len:282 (+),score=18.33 TRINITY_DN22595_c0_g1_i1:46-891(+)
MNAPCYRVRNVLRRRRRGVVTVCFLLAAMRAVAPPSIHDISFVLAALKPLSSRPSKASTALHAEYSDDLFHRRLNNEINRVNAGKRRSADRAQQRKWQPRRSRGSVDDVSSSIMSVVVRILLAACFLLPLVVSLPFGTPLLRELPVLHQLLVRPLMPLARLYHTGKYNRLLAIVGLYGLVARNQSLTPFARRIGTQAATLMMVQFPANYILQFLVDTPRTVFEMLQTCVFIYMVYCVGLGVLGCLSGSPAELPGIGDGTPPSFGRFGGSLRSTRFMRGKRW